MRSTTQRRGTTANGGTWRGGVPILGPGAGQSAITAGNDLDHWQPYAGTGLDVVMRNPLWDRLPIEVRDQVDGLVRDERKVSAIQAVLEGSEEPRPALHECAALVAERYAALGRRFHRSPTAPLELEDLAAKVQALPHRPAAVEALWDGDTEGWFVVLVAVTLHPRTDHHLATIRHGTDIRVFNRQVPPWPEAEEAIRVGGALAERLGVPFHFASPDQPDDEAPRW